MDILEIGDGDTELWLLHGSPGSPDRLEFLGEALSEAGYTVHIPDIYGFGGGEVPKVFRVEAIRAELVDAIGDTPVVGVGHSSGAYRLLDLALNTDVQLEQMVLLSPNPGVSKEARAGIEHLVGLVRKDTDIAPILVDAWLSERFKRDEKPTVQDMIAWFRELDPKLFLRMLEERKITPVITDQLGDINVPCLVIAGDAEQEMATSIAETLQAECVILDETGHFPHVEREEETISAIRSFLGS